jgi:hypothetical protein
MKISTFTDKAMAASLALAGAGLLASLGCGGSDTRPPISDAAASDAAVDAAVDRGPAMIVPRETIGGIIPAPDAAAPPVVLPTPYEPTTTGCCPVTLWVADPDGNETTAIVIGDLPPLRAGVPLTWKDGRWSANVCLPRDEQITYRFYFGKNPKPILVDDAGAPDAGDLADAGAVDASDPLPSIDAAGPLIDDYRFNPSFPTAPTGSGSSKNVYPAVSVCGTTGA